jgi:putative phosphonate metabolism protein
MSEQGPRYAIYFAPEARSPLWRFGCSVLGTDAEAGQDVAFPATLENTWPNWPALTSDPRKYGFHATLMAPFRLRDGIGKADLIDEVRSFAAHRRSCEIAGLKVASLGRFVALVPIGDAGALQALAAQIVDQFEGIRAPLSDADRTRRLKSSLTRAQTYYLDKYGYPYVHDEFRFHMTLTGGLPAGTQAAILAQLEALYAATVPPGSVSIDGLSLFRQDNPSAHFRIIARVPLL